MTVNETKTPFLALLIGPLLMLITLVLPAPFGMNEPSWLVIGLTVWMASWWISEAVPIPATAFLPLLVAPLLDLNSLSAVAQSYAHPLIFLFLGGFIISIAMERWSLHTRIALHTMLIVGSKPSQQIGGIMLVTAFLSMWMSNTATAVMMLPIALSITRMLEQDKQPSENDFSKAILLAVAYAASIGGLATLIGTPPNAFMAAFLQDTYGIRIGFVEWMIVGLPLSVAMLFGCWLWLTKFAYKLDQVKIANTRNLFHQKLIVQGKMQRGEKAVLIIFALTALLWITRPFLVKLIGLPLDDTIIAMLAAVLILVLPLDSKNTRILTWEETKQLPWGILMLFGGGLSLAALISKSGLASYIAEQVMLLDNMPLWLMVVLVTTVIVFLTEVTSNTATAAGFLPLLAPISLAMSGSPMTLVIPAAIAASCAFMMPVATPPNAIVFSSGHLRIADMVKAGFALNLFAVLLVSLTSLFLARWVFAF
ncbi:DASS family sodium-coupled anion symporter [Alishewanella sp. SMS8]|uniref:SLC13 family permease n=1 Tax=unclassified Alishewanella TaxID=2628974 RepID=UPI0027427E82|nr:DASS family sodium-coupled anion symporter [Alishewanella sp. SMS8]MDP5035426.1 DASS family sodium-coupled anion symporter [Alishewanella sp.]MDP5187821.1 DASS family sodium-coupled anion symporter [Alishewanella sp.]MDP5457933.1 DASS family sodium-coupled anion symporter [Alishewanella sp. SMS8]